MRRITTVFYIYCRCICIYVSGYVLQLYIVYLYVCIYKIRYIYKILYIYIYKIRFFCSKYDIFVSMYTLKTSVNLSSRSLVCLYILVHTNIYKCTTPCIYRYKYTTSCIYIYVLLYMSI